VAAYVDWADSSGCGKTKRWSKNRAEDRSDEARQAGQCGESENVPLAHGAVPNIALTISAA
jgi:hypothetical protein